MKRGAIAIPVRPEMMGDATMMDLELDTPTSSSSGETTTLQRDMADLAARTLVVALFTIMAVRLGLDFVQTGRLTGLLMLASEALVVVLTVFRRAAGIVDRSLEARTLTAISVMGPPLVQPASVGPLAPEFATVALSACGLFVVIGGKLSLGRSFGLMPANRGVVSTGLYRLVRHPIYMGYLLTHIAFLAANPTLWNLVMLVSSDAALLARAVCEERTLARDDAYRGYQQVVRWRVLPGVF
jgi:protein-S-isoprenylcysteine O-methyltransferase Ste14